MSSFNSEGRKTTRLPHYDYRIPGYYLVTLVTKNRIQFFGRIREGRMYLSKAGIVATKNWESIPDHFPHSALDTFIVMPNHIHGIIIIKDQQEQPPKAVRTLHATSQRENPMGRISPKAGSLSTIIRAYKSAVTRQLRQDGITDFGWVQRFYEHIIRDENELDNLREYILYNPLKWSLDRNNPEAKK